MKTKRHPFSYTLGPGPYRVVGMFDLGSCLSALHSGNINGYNNGLSMAPKDVSVGTCNHCGRAILDNYIVQNSDGKRFAVGSECILKASIKGEFENLSEFERKVRQVKRQKSKAQRENRRAKQAAEIKLVIDNNEAKLKSLPHPSKFHSNKTAFDYCIFCYRQGHISLGGIKYLKDALKKWEII